MYVGRIMSGNMLKVSVKKDCTQEERGSSLKFLWLIMVNAGNYLINNNPWY